MGSNARQMRLVRARPPGIRQSVAGTSNDVLVTRVGLQMPAGLSYDCWEAAGHQISAVADSSAWCLGDWIVYGQSRYTDRYRRAVEAVGLDYQTLRNYAWVSRSFELSRRRDALSFQHHAEVAALPPDEQDLWLDRAEYNKWSRNQLRRAVRGLSDDGPNGSSTSPRLGLSLTPERIARYRAAAEHSDSSLEAWVLEQLDVAASTVLQSPMSESRA